MSGQFNAIYPSFRAALLSGDIDMEAVTLRLVAVSGDYVYDQAHEVRSDLTGELATSPMLTGVVIDGPTVGCDPVTFAAVGPSDPIEGVVLLIDDGDEPLVAFFARRGDTVPLVIETNGGPVELSFSPLLRI